MSPPRARRPSIFNAEVIPDPRLLAQQQQQSPTSPTATQPVAVSGSPTQSRGESAASFPIQLSSSAASSVNSTSLLDHRGYPSPNYGPPTRRLSTMQGSSGTGAGSGQSASSSSSAAAAAAAAAAALSGTDDEDDSVTVGSESMPLLVGHEPAATLDKRNKQRMRRTGSIAREHELFMQRRANSDTAAVPAAGSTSAGHQQQQQQQAAAENEYHLDMNELANSYNDVSSEVGSVGRADHDGLDDFSRNMSTASLGDVCVPLESEVYDPDSNKQRCWPDVSALEEWVTTENAAANSGPELVMVDGRPRYREGPSYYLEDNTAQFKGRRPPGQQREPSRNPAERLGYPFRFTYFREDVEKTIHSQDISGLLGHGMSFSELFPVSNDVVPSTLATAMPSPVNEEVPIVVADEKGETLKPENTMPASMPEPQPPQSTLKGGMGGKFDSARSIKSRAGSSYFPSAGAISSLQAAAGAAAASSSRATSVAENRPYPFFLDILDPTDQEMKVISKAFGIHPLTTEDICMEETREKVELFRTYYLVCFRSFAIQPHMSARERRTRQGSEAARRRSNFGRKGDLVPVNMYLVVFRDGVLSFHFQPTPHPANVRRRIRQLRDYVSVSADWISYAIIDNVTDAFAPLISEIEDEVQAIDTEILEMHSGELSDEDGYDSDEYGDGDGEGGEGVDDYRSELNRKQRMRRRGQEGSETSSIFSSRSTRIKYDVKNRGDMLRRIGECRKQVMSIMRLLGFKADVIKGFAKRCNEQWEVAPRSEIGLYLGDIQDHIITMVQNLTHYEKLLARSHSNYLAQINIEMTAVNNETNDVLGRLTILGTIVLPMNIITGLWGMNVLVPGQEAEGLSWFYSITLGLIIFGLGCYFAAKKVYGIAV